jgi:hypothetical protein
MMTVSVTLTDQFPKVGVGQAKEAPGVEAPAVE